MSTEKRLKILTFISVIISLAFGFYLGFQYQKRKIIDISFDLYMKDHIKAMHHLVIYNIDSSTYYLGKGQSNIDLSKVLIK